MSIFKMVDQANEFQKRIALLKKMSSYWPSITYKNFDDSSVFASTLVRIKRDGKWYTVHCVESAKVPIGSHIMENVLERLIFSVHKIQNLYQLTGEHEDLDSIQIDEDDRLSKILNQTQL